MGQDSKIEWTHHTFNPWRGCTKVSAGCSNCYAETLSHRNPGTLGIWGPRGKRVVAAESAWREPLKWDRKAKAAGERHRVFCASLADVFESSNTMPPESVEPIKAARRRLLDLVCATPNLDWLLLTKRPENALLMMAEAGLYAVANPDLPCPQPNLWLGTSVEDQAAADQRIPLLLETPAAVRFLSIEPLLGPVDLSEWLNPACKGCDMMSGMAGIDGYWQCRRPGCSMYARPQGGWPDWVIVGGESGPHARPMHPQWARSIRDQCVELDIPFFFKQFGEWAPGRNFPDVIPSGELCDFNDPSLGDDSSVCRVGKKAAGRVLDGQTWDQLPMEAAPCPSE